MAVTALTNPPINAKTTAWAQVVLGYSMATVGLVINLASVGASGVPAVIKIITAGLSGLGILLATAGMLQLWRGVDRSRSAARRGLAMQSFGLILLLFGELALSFSSDLSILSVSAAFIVIAAVLGIGGALSLRGHYADIGASNRRGIDYLILGTALIYAGVMAIVFSKIGYYFVLSDLSTTLVNVVGVTGTACGSAIAAFSFVVLPAAAEDRSVVES